MLTAAHAGYPSRGFRRGTIVTFLSLFFLLYLFPVSPKIVISLFL